MMKFLIRFSEIAKRHFEDTYLVCIYIQGKGKYIKINGLNAVPIQIVFEKNKHIIKSKLKNTYSTNMYTCVS